MPVTVPYQSYKDVPASPKHTIPVVTNVKNQADTFTEKLDIYLVASSILGT
jgi:hypothetical protein